MQINKEKEQSISNFIEHLMEEKSPNYKELNNDVDLLSIADIALFLKKGDETPDNNFRNNLEETLLSQFKKDKLVNNELRKLKKEGLTRFAIGFASVLLIITGIMGLKTPNITTTLLEKQEEAAKREDVVRVEDVRVNGKIVKILYTKKNFAILYWPLGQFKTLQ